MEKHNRMNRYQRQLQVKQTQINYLLELTEAINSNAKIPVLFRMYREFLEDKLLIKKMAFFSIEDGEPYCKTYIGIKPDEIQDDLYLELFKYNKASTIEEPHSAFLGQFDLIIPCHHKNTPIAFVLISNPEINDEFMNNIKFISTITNIISVAIENKRLFKSQVKQGILAKEMELANNMQRSLTPPNHPKTKHYEISSYYQPHLEVGGDYFDFVQTKGNHLVFCIGDITGKGLAAALLMANLQAYFQTLVKVHTDLKHFVTELNEDMLRSTKGEKFVTFFMGVYNLETQMLQYVNCGHNPPLIFHKNKINELTKGCTLLGMFEKLPSIEVGEVKIEEDATILLYTDGLSDLRNERGDYLPVGRSKVYLKQNSHLNTKEFIDKLMEGVNDFRGEAEFPDDLTILCCKIFAQQDTPVNV